jgi:transposase
VAEGLFLSKKEQFVFRQICEFNSGKLSRKEAAKLLLTSERTVSRLASEVEMKGLKGVMHGNHKRPPANKTDDSIKQRVLNLVERKYYDFNMLHCLEVLRLRHKITVNRETFRRWCHEKQLVKRKKRRRSQPRFYRSRMPAQGYLLQMDGSPHKYNGRDIWSLVLAIDDATSEIPYAEFFESETTVACMKVLRQIILNRGLPRALYVDKAGWAGGGKRIEFTQFHRACEELGIQVLYANSPQAKGRVERAFNTIQDRIIPELRIHKIRSMKKANRYLKRQFLPKYWNKKNIVAPRQLQSEYRTLRDSNTLDEIFCYKTQRAVTNNHCISLNGEIYTVKHPNKLTLAKKRVELRLYDDRPMAIYFEGKKLQHKLLSKYEKIGSTWEQHVHKLETTYKLR